MAKPLYLHTGGGPVDTTAWPQSGESTPDGKPLYTFSGDVDGEAPKGASADWQVYAEDSAFAPTVPTPTPTPTPTPSPSTTSVDSAPLRPYDQPQATPTTTSTSDATAKDAGSSQPAAADTSLAPQNAGTAQAPAGPTDAGAAPAPHDTSTTPTVDSSRDVVAGGPSAPLDGTGRTTVGAADVKDVSGTQNPLNPNADHSKTPEPKVADPTVPTALSPGGLGAPVLPNGTVVPSVPATPAGPGPADPLPTGPAVPISAAPDTSGFASHPATVSTMSVGLDPTITADVDPIDATIHVDVKFDLPPGTGVQRDRTGTGLVYAPTRGAVDPQAGWTVQSALPADVIDGVSSQEELDEQRTAAQADRVAAQQATMAKQQP